MAANSFQAKRVKSGGGMCFDHTPSSAIDAGDVVLVGTLLGIAEVDIPAGDTGSLAQDGVFDIAKESTTDTFTAGDIVFWDSSAGTIVASPGTATDKKIGQVTEDAAATDETARVSVFPIAEALVSA